MRTLAWIVWIALAIVPPAAAERPPTSPGSRFGVVVVCDGRSASEVESDLEAAAGLGVGWVRLRPDWTRMQPTPTALDWTFSDRVLQAAAERNLSVVLTLGNTPRWASRYPDEADPQVWNLNAPERAADWQAYLQALVEHYGSTVHVWQVWDRSAIHFFRGSDKDLTALARAAVPILRRQVESVVLMPETGGVNLGSINRLYARGAQEVMQGLALYPDFQRPEQILRPLHVLQTRIVAKKGPPMGLWIAGFGWGVEPVEGPLRSAPVSEEDQACYLVRLATLALANGVERVAWQTLRDHDRGTYQVQSRSGLLRLDGTRRPAYQAYQNLIQQLGDRPLIGQANWGPHAYGFLFGSPGGDGVLVAWTDRPPVRLAPPPAGAHQSVVDIRGQPASAEVVSLGPSPVFVKGGAAALGEWMQTPAVEAALADPDRSRATSVTVRLSGPLPEEDGLEIRTPAKEVRQVDPEGTPAWSTDLAGGKTALLFDVDDSFAYFIDALYEVEVQVVVYGNTGSQPMGFNLGYNGLKGYSFTRWQWIDSGAGWKTYSFRLRDADFSDPVADFRINALGSQADVVVHSVRVSR